MARRLPLIGAMARDLDQHGTLRPSTATVMWAAQTAHALLMTRTLRRPGVQLPLPASPANATGAALVGVGLATCLAGLGCSAFTGPSELTGTRNLRTGAAGRIRQAARSWRTSMRLGHATGALAWARSP